MRLSTTGLLWQKADGTNIRIISISFIEYWARPEYCRGKLPYRVFLCCCNQPIGEPFDDVGVSVDNWLFQSDSVDLATLKRVRFFFFL